MKAVLEFSYPQDTDKCRRAIHADEAFDSKERNMTTIAWSFIAIMLTLMTLRSIYA